LQKRWSYKELESGPAPLLQPPYESYSTFIGGRHAKIRV
jgi:hypothetical protein